MPVIVEVKGRKGKKWITTRRVRVKKRWKETFTWSARGQSR